MPIIFNAELFAETAANLVHLERWALKAQHDASADTEVEYTQRVRRHARALSDALRNPPSRATATADAGATAP